MIKRRLLFDLPINAHSVDSSWIIIVIILESGEHINEEKQRSMQCIKHRCAVFHSKSNDIDWKFRFYDWLAFFILHLMFQTWGFLTQSFIITNSLYVCILLCLSIIILLINAKWISKMEMRIQCKCMQSIHVSSITCRNYCDCARFYIS